MRLKCAFVTIVPPALRGLSGRSATTATIWVLLALLILVRVP